MNRHPRFFVGKIGSYLCESISFYNMTDGFEDVLGLHVSKNSNFRLDKSPMDIIEHLSRHIYRDNKTMVKELGITSGKRVKSLIDKLNRYGIVKTFTNNDP